MCCQRKQLINPSIYQKEHLKMVGFGPADVPPSVAVKFVGAGAAGCVADLITFPLDTAKVRLQVNWLVGNVKVNIPSNFCIERALM